jgi:hypothetical protein
VKNPLARISLAAFFCVFIAVAAQAQGLPEPKEGVLFAKAESARVREAMMRLGDSPTLKKVFAAADKARADWPTAKAEITPHLGAILDLNAEANPRDVVPRNAADAAKRLREFTDSAPALGFKFFLTGDAAFAQTAFEIIDAAGRPPRWGWFNWDGANMPQIHFAMITRNIAYAVDLCWAAWSPAQRERAVRVLAGHGVESYWRIVNHSPFMGFHHLRTKNQGNNAASAAVVASCVVGESVPENKIWFDSLVQGFAWLVAHDIGWAGQNLESGMPGYWSVSMQNLYTAAAALANARGIDLRAHPSFAEATWYPIFHEATVPPVGMFEKPFAAGTTGGAGVIGGKPIELPHEAYCGAWWYDYARRFPESPAAAFIFNSWGRVAEAHQHGHADLLRLLWVETMEKPAQPRKPADLFKTTDRMTMFRSGYGAPHTYLYFNGDLFLSARNEILGTTAGLAWHFPWHQFAVTESAIETEGRAFSPSMVVKDYFHSDLASFIHAECGPSNVRYYPQRGQAVAHREYDSRTRAILYVRSDDTEKVRDYFVFIDRVAHGDARWHAFNWHLWNSPENPGRFDLVAPNVAIGCRPNADVLLATLSHERMTFEQQGVASQPNLNYQDDHNALLLRAIAGPSRGSSAVTKAIPASAWKGAGTIATEDGRAALVLADFKTLAPKARVDATLEAGARYRVSLRAKKRDARVYENTAWIINLRLLGADGAVLAEARTPEREPHPLRLSDPASFRKDYDWLATETFFDAPPGVRAIEAEFHAAQYSHPPHGLRAESKLWLGEILIEPLGVLARSASDQLVTLVMPLPKAGVLPAIQTRRADGALTAEITHPDGTRDTLEVDARGVATLRRKNSGTDEFLALNSSRVALDGKVFSSAARPFHSHFTGRDGVLAGKISVRDATEIEIDGRRVKASAGPSLLVNGRLDPVAAEASLASNSPANQALLRAGLEPLTRANTAARDALTAQGRRNLAREATVTASAALDARFSASNLIDNQAWEFPANGRIDYTLGEIRTTSGMGYGRGEAMSYTNNMSEWPLYVTPTWWLLPPRQTGSVTLTLREPARIDLVRLLNTGNGGLHDHATVNFRVELLGPAGQVLASRDDHFGVARDGGFDAAFARPDFFRSYGPSFKGILERGVIVPFGAGWKEVVFANQPKLVHAVRIHVLSFWSLGGGLNEVQIYAAP